MVGEKLTFKTASIITLCFGGWEKNGEYSPVFLVAFVSKISGHRCRVKHRQLVVESPLIGERFLTAAGDIENKFE